MILTLNECNRSDDFEESVIGFVTYRDRPDAIQKTVDIYEIYSQETEEQADGVGQDRGK